MVGGNGSGVARCSDYLEFLKINIMGFSCRSHIAAHRAATYLLLTTMVLGGHLHYHLVVGCSVKGL